MSSLPFRHEPQSTIRVDPGTDEISAVCIEAEFDITSALRDQVRTVSDRSGASDVDLLVASASPGSLALPATGREVAHYVAVRAAACVGADYSNLALLNPDGSSLRLYHGPFLDPELAAHYTDVPLDAPYPIAAAAREGRVVLLPDLASYEEEFSGLVPDTISAGLQATASLPLYRFNGTVLGAIGFAWSEPTVFDRKLEAALRAVGHLCVETVERAERYDADHDLIVALHDRLLPSLPALAGLRVGARYTTSDFNATVGGDWYEGLLLGEGKIALVVGDVVGHGLTAAADMALIRGMISALLHAAVKPSQIFEELTGLLSRCDSPLLATAALAIVDVPASTLTFATAGHPPPLLQLPSGNVEILDTANAPMIGVPLDLTGKTQTVSFTPGSRLVMYTDGLVERRDRFFDDGIRQAVSHLSAMTQHVDPDQVIQSLRNALIGDKATEDDVAVLVVEHTRR
jgi:serine phosphatase RsbU (regulator of sigma subunit)